MAKIGINGRALFKPFTGIGQYTKNLVKALAELDKKNEYILVVTEKLTDDVAAFFPKNVRVKILPEKHFPLAGMRKTWWEQISLVEFFLAEKIDVAFFPYPSSPWSKDWYKKGVKTVVTVHDCIPWTNEDYRGGFLSKLYHAQTKKAVKLAGEILTVSQHSKKLIVEVCDVEAEKIHVIYNDVDEAYKRPVDEDFAHEVLKRFRLKRGKFFLYCGGYDKRKNVNYLLEEYLASGSKWPLVLVGEKLFNSKLYESFDEADGVIKTGFLKEQELAALYGSCKAFLHMSKEEGFNIPLLEAANCGAPLVLSNIAVHREIAGGFATFVDISKTSALTKILRAGKFVSSAGLAKKFSWKKSAEEVRKILMG